MLGDLSADAFLQRYWQQKPLLIRHALANYRSPISGDELAGLALESEVESRLVESQGGDWTLKHGPFTEEDFLGLPEEDWTLLVQGVDLWVPEVQALLSQFAFLPPWRLDDVMVSFACPGGSVGPHFDQYDVFLLQVEGQRRWQIGAACSSETPMRDDSPLRILKEFEAEEEWVLEPGDMLYLPPGVAHWGVAETECLTFSIGRWKRSDTRFPQHPNAPPRAASRACRPAQAPTLLPLQILSRYAEDCRHASVSRWSMLRQSATASGLRLGAKTRRTGRNGGRHCLPDRRS